MRSPQTAQRPCQILRSQLVRTGLLAVLLAAAFIAVAAETESVSESPDWLQLVLGLFGGLALFLGGLQMLSEGMTKAAGQTLKKVLAKLTTNRFKGALTGAFVTGVLNSSTVTTLLVVGFISGGMMNLAQSVGVIMGANIGSTVTAQLLAFNLSAYSLGPVAVGFFMLFTAKQDKVKYYGMMIMGIGLVFYGMGLMSDAMTPLRSFEPFLEILKGLERPVAGIVAGALFTAIVQSSAATVGIAIAMASEGLLALPAGIALALGANIGTAVTTAFMGILSSKSTDAVRASVVHVAFNILGTLIWLPLIGRLVDLAVWVSPASPELDGMARAAAEVPRQIANANTLFNVINTLLFIGFTTWFARLAERLIPERAPTKGVIIEPEFLDDAALEAPSIALENARREIERAGHITLEMMDALRTALENKNTAQLEEVARRDDEVDILEAEILSYLGRARQQSLTEDESATQESLLAAMLNLESVADVIETDMVGLAKAYLEGEYEASSQETQDMVAGLFEAVRRSIELVAKAVGQSDQRAAQDVLLLKAEIRDFADRLFERHAQRLHSDDPKYLQRVRLMMTFIEDLRHMYTLTKRIAKTQIPAALAQQEV